MHLVYIYIWYSFDTPDKQKITHVIYVKNTYTNFKGRITRNWTDGTFILYDFVEYLSRVENIWCIIL